jgi:hypothetical protein
VGYGGSLWYRRSGWLEPLRLLWGRFEGKAAEHERSRHVHCRREGYTAEAVEYDERG